MFHTTLLDEYENARRMGLSETELTGLIQASFDHAFDPAARFVNSLSHQTQKTNPQ